MTDDCTDPGPSNGTGREEAPPERDAPGELVLHANTEFRITYANAAYRDLFGDPKGELDGLDFMELIHPDDVAEVKRSLARLSRPPYVTHHEERARTVRGWRWLSWTVRAHRDRQGHLAGLQALGRDVTDLKEEQRALLQKTDRIEKVLHVGRLANGELELGAVLQNILQGTVDALEASIGMIFLRDMSTGCLSWGASLGLPEEFVAEYRNRSILPGEGLSGRIAQDGTPIFIGADSSNDARIARDVIRRQGFHSFIGVPINDAGQVVGVMNILTQAPAVLTEGDMALCAAIGTNVGMAIRNARLFSQVTEAEKALRESETKYRSMMEAMQDQVYICSPDFRVTYMNPALIQRLGHDATGEPCFRALHGLDERCAWCQFDPVAAAEFRDVEIKSPLNQRDYLVSQSPLAHEDGTISKLTIYKDITDLKQAERDLQHKRQLESVGRLAGGVAHDFNNMLGVILCDAELALETVRPSDPAHDCLKEIELAARRSAAVTKQLLAIARKQPIAPRVIQLNDTIEGMLGMLRHLVGEDIRLVWEPGDRLWTIKMDPSQIHQILTNLSANARDAIARTGTITIQTSNVTVDETSPALHPGVSPGDYVRLDFSDDGCGMDAEAQKQIFEPFYTTKSQDQGTGLGLATAYGIVRQNRGFIGVTSEVNRGATFSICLPRCLEAEALAPRKEHRRDRARGHETVLLVEDEPAVLRTAERILARSGYRVLTASTPAEAMQLMQEHAQDIRLVVTDVVMPEMDGRQLADQLQSLCPALKCLFMSGYPVRMLSHRGVLDEGLHFIEKPFTSRALSEKVREVLDEPGGVPVEE